MSGRGAARAEDAQGTPTQSHISPSKLVYEDNHIVLRQSGVDFGRTRGVDFRISDCYTKIFETV